MKNLHIVLELNTPIELPKYPISLDGLLYWAIVLNGGDESLLDVVLAKKDDIYLASALRFVRAPYLCFEAMETAHPICQNWPDFPFKTDKKAVCEKGGPYRRKMTSRLGILAKQIDFHAVGNAEKIEYLLKILGFIGLSNNQGFGEIVSVTATEIDDDYSWFDEQGELARVLPVKYVEQESKYLKDVSSYKPNYATSERVACCLPNFRQITIF